MNIFVLSSDANPHRHFAQQALYHCDKHVIKMIAESTQMIVTALDTPTYYNLIASIAATHGVNGSICAAPCKPLSAGHAKHPCALWARAQPENLWYLVRLANALCTQKLSRWPGNNAHQYQRYLTSLVEAFTVRGYSLHDALPESFTIAIPKHTMAGKQMDLPNTVLAYRTYYATDKARFATWRRPAMTPVWFTLAVEALRDVSEERSEVQA